MSFNKEEKTNFTNKDDSAANPAALQKSFEFLDSQKTALEKLASSRNLTDLKLPELMKLRSEAQDLERRLPVTSGLRSEVKGIADFAQAAIDGIKGENRNQKDLLKSSRKDLSQDLSQVESGRNSTSFRGDSPFTVSTTRRFNGLPVAGDGGEQSKLLKELKDVMEKTASDLNTRLDRMDTNVNSRLDRLGAELHQATARLSQLETNEAAVRAGQTRCEDALNNLTRTAVRTEEYSNSLGRKVDDLISSQRQQQQQPTQPAAPLQVNLNLTGLPAGLTFNTGPTSSPSDTGATAVSQKSVLSTVTPVQQQQPGPPVLSVSVPRGPATQEVTPITTAKGNLPHEAKGSSTVAWGAPQSASTAKTPAVPPKQETKPAIPSTTTSAAVPQYESTILAPPKADGAKASLFGGFQGFGISSSASNAPAPALGGGLFSSGAFSSPGGNAFADLAKTASPGGGGFGGGSSSHKPFPGTGTLLFGGGGAVKAADDSDEDNQAGAGQDDTYEPNVSFKPLVSLPEVEVKTGEENFEKLFSDRCKLFRYDKATNEWKERGLGDMSIQRQTDAPAGKVSIRVLMRWEKTLKICANHPITPGMKIEPMNASDVKTFKWVALDFSDGESKMENLAARFKTPEQANKFKAAFENALKQVAGVGGSASPGKPASQQLPMPETEKVVAAVKAVGGGGGAVDTSKPPPNWGDQFKPKDGAWSCKECYSSNPAGNLKCAACTAPKPGSVAAGPSNLSSLLGERPSLLGAPPGAPLFGSGLFGNSQPAAAAPADSAPKFSFGYQPPAVPLKEAKSEGTGLFGGAKPSPAPFAGFGLGTASTTVPSFGGAGGFGGFSTPSKPATTAAGAAGFSFNSPSLSNFSFDLGSALNKPPSGAKKAGDGAAGHEDDSGGEDDNDVESERTDLYFKPVVKLPDNVHIVTGEENEVELYSQRAKLYRFDADSSEGKGEWKERGLGDMKMLKERNGNKIRFLMRREKILKVCCNHMVGPTVDLHPMPGTKNSWMWNAQDFSDGNIVHEKFALRFKHEQHWKEFKELVDLAKAIVAGTASSSGEKFPRVQVDEAETNVPIVESRKKALEEMAVNNPFGSPSSPMTTTTPRREPIVEGPPTSSPTKPDSNLSAGDDVTAGALDGRGTMWGDKSYKRFGAIFNGRNEAVAIGVPSVGFFRLKSPRDLDALIAADARSEEALRDEISRLTVKIDMNDLESVPEAVRRYGRAMKIKEYGDDDAWKMVLFERQLTLHKKLVGGNFKPVGPGLLRITRDGDYDSPYLIQHFPLPNAHDTSDPTELAVHTVVHDCNLELDRKRLTAQWTANDYANEEDVAVRADFQVKFSNPQALVEFEKVLLDGITIAEESDTSLRTTLG
ncbi:putative E3 SUMO-protein ligase RanBP2 [Hypsibius exemplaris]|uniref:E3 SUMO-protein ligase RanBP2 n=1 Tax=Hypsibius exemplaris TaxID=2072580 RepID=A0A1W0WDC8_HYPEX|nr:putative E3 SUMO-protein ligase RanBP2 [Hypsibius exemplaris]